jgi:histidinol-phosphatase
MRGEFDADRIGGRKAIADLIDEIVAAGEEALRLYRAGAARRMQKKPDRSPVTEADRAVEERLLGFLRSRYPEAGFLGEETGSSGPPNGVFRWVVDPIDGTRAFLRGIPTWSILVGLEADGLPALGIAYMPADAEIYLAIKGEGATCNGRPLHVSRIEKLEDSTIAHGSLAQFTDLHLDALLHKLVTSTYTQRGFHDFDGYRQVLHGRADAMVDPGVAPWDICAAAVLVREAGGKLTSMDGEETIHGGGAVASNGLVHADLVRALVIPE